MEQKNLVAIDDFENLDPFWGVFWSSVLGLFLQMLFIRWIGTEIRIFAYLQNTILVVCFLGLGLGMFTSSRPIRLSQSLIPFNILLLLMAIPVTRSFLGNVSEMLSSGGDMLIWYSVAINDSWTRLLYLIVGLFLTFVTLVLIVDIFVPVGRIIGRLMDHNHNSPVLAYSINIGGSIIGTWLFVSLSYFYLPPIVWFVFTGMLLVFFIYKLKNDKRLNTILLVIAMLLSWFASQTPGALEVVWSPYQKLALRESNSDEVGQYIINVNNVGYQAIVNLDDEYVSLHPEKFPEQQKGLSQYDLPLLFHPAPQSFLVVGAGSGNDVSGALRQGVPSIVAIEIDPAIIAMGRELHPEKPYSSPNVQIINDDARSFFSTTTDTYDVISFGLLDSHTTTSMTNARLDHYVYTKESLTQAKSLLNPGGVMVLTFEATKPYIVSRMFLALKEVFQQDPLVFRIPANEYGWGGVMFVTGDLDVVQKQLNDNPRLNAFVEQLKSENPIHVEDTIKPTTDDWPYLYLETPTIPPLYFMLIGLIIIIFMRSSKKWDAAHGQLKINKEFGHFFFLGAAFLLLEVQNISKASVALGNTWQVNAVVVSSILFMALLANLVITRFPKISIVPVYAALIAVSLSLYFVDLAKFGFLPYLTKAVIIGILTSLPMFFSGIIFTSSFSSASNKSNALGANLIGALFGALLQSITFITGIKALLLVVTVLYLFSLLTILQKKEIHTNVAS